jgi:hypothetical protein
MMKSKTIMEIAMAEAKAEAKQQKKQEKKALKLEQKREKQRQKLLKGQKNAIARRVYDYDIYINDQHIIDESSTDILTFIEDHIGNTPYEILSEHKEETETRTPESENLTPKAFHILYHADKILVTSYKAIIKTK